MSLHHRYAKAMQEEVARRTRRSFGSITDREVRKPFTAARVAVQLSLFFAGLGVGWVLAISA